MMALDVLTYSGGWWMSRCVWVRGLVALKRRRPPFVGFLMRCGLRPSLQGSALYCWRGSPQGWTSLSMGSRKTSTGWIQGPLVPLHLWNKTVLCWRGGTHSREGRRSVFHATGMLKPAPMAVSGFYYQERGRKQFRVYKQSLIFLVQCKLLLCPGE